MFIILYEWELVHLFYLKINIFDKDALIKQEMKFSSYKEIKMGSAAKSYMRKDFLIYEEKAQIFNHI